MFNLSSEIFQHNKLLKEIKYIIQEELDNTDENKLQKCIRHFQHKCKHSSDTVTPIDVTYRHIIKRIHVIEINTPIQAIFYQNLHYCPHYSIGNFTVLQQLEQLAQLLNVEWVFYDVGKNHVDITDSKPVVLNEFRSTDYWNKKFGIDEIYKHLQIAKLDVKRNTKRFTCGFTGLNASGWTYKIEDLMKQIADEKLPDDISSNLTSLLKMEGFSDTLSKYIMHSIGNILNWL